MRWEVSIIGLDIIDLIKKANPQGLCMRKFKADYIIDDIDFSQIQIGDSILIDDKILIIDQVGKSCYDGCVLHDNNLYCPLRNGCAFGHWGQPGKEILKRY